MLHKCLIMEAEVLSLECRNLKLLTNAYDEAIFASVKMGYSQDAALGSELAGASMLAINEDERADEYLNQACNLWEEYGANAKVRHIKMHSNLDLEDKAHDFSISFGPHTYTSQDLRVSRASLSLDLLVGTYVKNDFKMEASATTSTAGSFHEIEVESGDTVFVRSKRISDPLLESVTECKS